MYSFVSTPSRFPHHCHSCHVGTGREWYVDFGDEELSGETPVTIYICNLCMVAIAAEQGIVPRKPLDDEIENLKVQLFDAQVKADGLEQAFDGALRARFIVPNDTAAVELVSAQQGEESVETGSEGGEGSFHSGQEHVESGEGISPKSIDVQDMGAVPNGISIDGRAE